MYYSYDVESCSLSPIELSIVLIYMKVIAKRLLQSKQSIPHYYLSVDIEMDKVIKFVSTLFFFVNSYSTFLDFYSCCCLHFIGLTI